jgi:hypothetical protein
MSITKVKKIKSYPTKWDEAIVDARRKIRELKDSIEFFKQRKREKEPWPGDSATQN